MRSLILDTVVLMALVAMGLFLAMGCQPVDRPIPPTSVDSPPPNVEPAPMVSDETPRVTTPAPTESVVPPPNPADSGTEVQIQGPRGGKVDVDVDGGKVDVDVVPKK